MKFLKYINIRSNAILLFVAVCCMTGFFIVEKNMIKRKDKLYDEKLAAATLSKKAAQTLKDYYLGNVEFVDNINDPNETGLIGFEYSPITSERGSFSAKTSTTNPNYAALIVQFLKELDVKEGDYIAVGVTGSFPGLNISLYAALQTLKLNPIIITSVASSSWGANDPDFTWLDMEKVLSDSGVFKFTSVAASIGASKDIGRGLSTEGVDMIKDAVKRNNTELIYCDTIPDDITQRMKIYSSYAKGNPLKAYINVGGGVASLGSKRNGRKIPSGLNKSISMEVFKDKKGVVYEMAKQEIPVIHLLDISMLAKTYGLPMKPIPLPEPGTGKLFEDKKYDLTLVAPITFFLLTLIIFIIYQDKKNVRLGKEILRKEQKTENEMIL
jgi:poly-gamma-glutamate system protein